MKQRTITAIRAHEEGYISSQKYVRDINAMYLIDENNVCWPKHKKEKS